ncbi:MAG: hypothetical protein A2Z34_09605, partial [Planctomycetes bacterium RBG_16_59_8]
MARICFVTNFCPPYRAGVFRLLAERLPVDFFFCSRGEERYWNPRVKRVEEGAAFHHLDGFTLVPGIRVTPGLIAEASSTRYDVVVKCLNGKFALPAAFLAAKLTGKKFILWQTMWSHPTTILHRLSYPFLRLIQACADAIVVYGEHGRRYLQGLGLPSRKIFVARQAVDNSWFGQEVAEEDRRALRRSLGIGDRKVVLYVGRLEESKGIPFLVKAVAAMGERRPLLLMIGSGSGRAELDRSIREHGLERDVRVIDHVENLELYRYYAIADLVALPSITTRREREPWGLVLNEAMNQGRPVVATDAVGAAVGGLVREGENGLVVPERDAGALRRAMERILGDDALRARMGRAAR